MDISSILCPLSILQLQMHPLFMLTGHLVVECLWSLNRVQDFTDTAVVSTQSAWQVLDLGSCKTITCMNESVAIGSLFPALMTCMFHITSYQAICLEFTTAVGPTTLALT